MKFSHKFYFHLINIQVGIIGGSGFYNLPELDDPVFRSVETDYGSPSDQLVEGTIHGVPCVVIARYVLNIFFVVVG